MKTTKRLLAAIFALVLAITPALATGEDVFTGDETETIAIYAVQKNVFTGIEDGKYVFEDKPIKGAVYEIYADEDVLGEVDGNEELLYEDGTLLGSVTTDNNGYAVIHAPDDVPVDTRGAKVRLVEKSVPSGIKKADNTEVWTELFPEGPHEVIISFERTGEIYETEPYDVTITATKKVPSFKDGELSYESASLECATYGIYAAKAIYDDEGNRVYAKDAMIERVTTDDKGEAKNEIEMRFKDVYVKEISIPDDVEGKSGKLTVTFDEEKPEGQLKLSYDAQTISITGVAPITQDGQKVSLLAKSDIKVGDEIVVEKGTVIKTKELQGGEVIFSDLPTSAFGEEPLYELKEEGAADGYFTKDGDYSVKGDEDASVSLQYTSRKTTIKVNDEDGNKLSGAILQVLDSSGNVVIDNFTSTGDDDFDALKSGSYILHEVHPAAGYIKSGDKTFSVSDDPAQTINITETANKVTVSVVDSADASVTTGANLQLKDASGTLIKEAVDGVLEISALPAGEYTVTEASAPYGYQKAENITFTVDEETETYTQTLTSKRTFGYVSIQVLSSVNREKLQGATYLLKNGEMIIASMTTDAEGKAESAEVEIGKYENGKFLGETNFTLIEDKAPEGYTLDTNAYTVTFTYLNDTTPVVMVNATLPNKKTIGEVPEMTTVQRQVGTRTVQVPATSTTTASTTQANGQSQATISQATAATKDMSGRTDAKTADADNFAMYLALLVSACACVYVCMKRRSA